jgi:hypothetical protein
MVPEYLSSMVRRQPPAASPVVSGSTPVVAFGDPGRAEVATLGINPSDSEFLENGMLLRGGRRRLATLESLGAEDLGRLTEAQVAVVISECTTYFGRRPHSRWFNPLDRLLRAALGVSYYEGTACHLDLIQWATSPTWGKIRDPAIRRALLEDGTPHLRAQLAHENVRLVLLNGRQVLDEVQAVGFAHMTEKGVIPLRSGACRLYVGAGGGVRWLGWSTNLQSSWGVSGSFKQELGAWLSDAGWAAEGAAVPARAEDGASLDLSGYLPRGLRVYRKSELVELLGRWLAASRVATLGDVASFGGKPWVIVELTDRRVVLNADTKRRAVEAFLHESGDAPERPWRVIANQRGRVNKVLPGPGLSPGWYAYLEPPLDAEGSI